MMQGRKGDADIEKGLVDTVGEGKRRMEKVASVYIDYPGVRWIAGEKMHVAQGA